jgi:hypothetical protein
MAFIYVYYNNEIAIFGIFRGCYLHLRIRESLSFKNFRNQCGLFVELLMDIDLTDINRHRLENFSLEEGKLTVYLDILDEPKRFQVKQERNPLILALGINMDLFDIFNASIDS